LLKQPFYQEGLKRILLGFLLLITTLSANPLDLNQSEKLWLSSHLVIRVGFHANKPPYSFVNTHGEVDGILSSYFEHFGTLLNIQFIKIHAASWEELFNLMNRGQIDIVGGMPSHLNLPNFITPTQTIFNVPLSILVPKNSTIFENFEEFLKKRIATPEKQNFKTIVENSYPSLNLLQSKVLPRAFEDLNSNQFDGFLAEARVIEHQLSSSKLHSAYSNYNLPISYELQIGSHRDLPYLHSVLQKTISSITDKQKVMFASQWIIMDEQPTIQVWHMLIICILLTIAFILFFAKHRLIYSKITKLNKEYNLAQTHLETVVDALNAGSWVWHISENKNIISNRYASMLGYQKSEIVPTFDGIMALVAPEDTTLLLSALKRHIDKIEPYFSVYIKLRHKDGNYRLIHSFGGILAYSEDGSPKTLGGCNMLVHEEAIVNNSELPVDKITGILTHHHYQAFVPLYFKQARNEYSGVMLLLFRLGFQENEEGLRQEALERFSVALFEHLPAPSGLCFYMGERVFSSFYWSDDPNEAQIIAQDLHAQLENIMTSFSASIYLHSGTAFMIPGSKVDESNLYQNAYVNLAQKDSIDR